LQESSKKATGELNEAKSMRRQQQFPARTKELAQNLAHVFHQWFMALVTSACES
jgi:hypothetical protein